MRGIRTATGVVALLAALSLLAAACADSIGDPSELAQGTDGSGQGADGSENGGDEGHTDLNALRQCLEDNGVETPSFEHESRDENHSLTFSFELALPDFDTEARDRAFQACADLLPELDPELAQGLEGFEECLREQGVEIPDLPGLGEGGFGFDQIPDIDFDATFDGEFDLDATFDGEFDFDAMFDGEFDFDAMFDAMSGAFEACSGELPEFDGMHGGLFGFGGSFEGSFDGLFSGEWPFGHETPGADDTSTETS